MDFHAAGHVQESQDFAHGWMLDFFDAMTAFDLGIDDLNAVLEERRQVSAGEVTVFVDGGGQHGPAMLTIPGGIVGPAAKERDSVWGAADDHLGCNILSRRGRNQI